MTSAGLMHDSRQLHPPQHAKIAAKDHKFTLFLVSILKVMYAPTCVKELTDNSRANDTIYIESYQNTDRVQIRLGEFDLG